MSTKPKSKAAPAAAKAAPPKTGAKPAAKPAAKSVAKSAATKPAGKPATKPEAKTQAKQAPVKSTAKPAVASPKQAPKPRSKSDQVNHATAQVLPAPITRGEPTTVEPAFEGMPGGEPPAVAYSRTQPAPGSTGVNMVVDVPVEAISASPFQPRKSFDETKIAELARSIAEQGVLQPILVRYNDQGAYELVAGERRLRAAKSLGLETIPAYIRALTDDQAADAAITENLQRSDIHPMDEAVAFDQLHAAGRTVKDIALRIGKSEAYVYQRIRLTRLSAFWSKLFFEQPDVLTFHGALTIAALEPQQQDELQREVVSSSDEGKSYKLSVQYDSWKYIKGALDRTLLLNMTRAPFDTADPSLVPTAGACTSCPKRTGANTVLFDELIEGDYCTDKACHALKCTAMLERIAKMVELEVGKAPVRVMSGVHGFSSAEMNAAKDQGVIVVGYDRPKHEFVTHLSDDEIQQKARERAEWNLDKDDPDYTNLVDAETAKEAEALRSKQAKLNELAWDGKAVRHAILVNASHLGKRGYLVDLKAMQDKNGDGAPKSNRSQSGSSGLASGRDTKTDVIQCAILRAEIEPLVSGEAPNYRLFEELFVWDFVQYVNNEYQRGFTLGLMERWASRYRWEQQPWTVDEADLADPNVARADIPVSVNFGALVECLLSIRTADDQLDTFELLRVRLELSLAELLDGDHISPILEDKRLKPGDEPSLLSVLRRGGLTHLTADSLQAKVEDHLQQQKQAAAEQKKAAKAAKKDQSATQGHLAPKADNGAATEAKASDDDEKEPSSDSDMSMFEDDFKIAAEASLAGL